MKTTDCDRMYRQQGKVAHLVPFGDPTALCGQVPNVDIPMLRDNWYGTGSMSEYDRAEALPLCLFCAEELT